jgi:Holliday junction resolvase RusA-like endonuclease
VTGFPITVPGECIPQGSKSVNKRTGSMFESNPRLKEWRKQAGVSLQLYTGTFFGAWEPYDGPLHIDVTFYLPRGKTVTRELPSVKPDLDKLQRALGDMLTITGIITDDARITRWSPKKRYGDPCTVIHLIEKDTP